MTHIPLFAAIPAGGAGTRLAPASRPDRPKPLLPMPDPAGPSLLAQTLQRLEGLVPAARRRIVVGRALSPVFAAADSTPQLVEPDPRGTGPALTLAAAWAAAEDPEAILLNAPADHWIADDAAFCATIARAAELAVRGWLVLLGVPLGAPDPGYGYILPDKPLHAWGQHVRGFREKPPLSEAARLLAAGALANAGIFVWRARTFLDVVAELEPEWLAAVQGGIPDEARWAGLRTDSVDRAVLEHVPARLAMLPLESAWDDVGTWPRLRARMLALGLTSEEGPFVWAPGRTIDDAAPGEAVVAVDNREWRGTVADLDTLAARSGAAG